MAEHVKAEWWYGNEQNLPDGSYIDKYGSVCYVKNKKLHREDGPAVEWDDGGKRWYKNGELHREDGPAIEWSGGKVWWVNGKKYNDEVEYKEAIKIFMMNEAMK